MARLNHVFSPSKCIKDHAIKYAFTSVNIMKIQFNQLVPRKFDKCKESGFKIPNQTSTPVITVNIINTIQIFYVFDSCACPILCAIFLLN